MKKGIDYCPECTKTPTPSTDGRGNRIYVCGTLRCLNYQKITAGPFVQKDEAKEGLNRNQATQ